MPGEPDRPQPDRLLQPASPLAALVRGWGGEPTLLDIARDDAALIAAARIAAGAQHDLLVTTGGASVGEHDLVQDALRRRASTMDFWKHRDAAGQAADVRPPGIDARVLGLPGNPVSTMVCALLFLKPALERMLGQPGDLVATRAGAARRRPQGERHPRGLCPLQARPRGRRRPHRRAVIRCRTAPCSPSSPGRPACWCARPTTPPARPATPSRSLIFLFFPAGTDPQLPRENLTRGQN